MTNIIRKITPQQQRALDWLTARGGDGAFVQGGGTIIAQGEIAPHERKTWVALRDANRVEFYNSAGKGYGRVRVINATTTTPPRETSVDPAHYRHGRVEALPGAE